MGFSRKKLLYFLFFRWGSQKRFLYIKYPIYLGNLYLEGGRLKCFGDTFEGRIFKLNLKNLRFLLVVRR